MCNIITQRKKFNCARVTCHSVLHCPEILYCNLLWCFIFSLKNCNFVLKTTNLVCGFCLGTRYVCSHLWQWITKKLESITIMNRYFLHRIQKSRAIISKTLRHKEKLCWAWNVSFDVVYNSVRNIFPSLPRLRCKQNRTYRVFHRVTEHGSFTAKEACILRDIPWQPRYIRQR